MNPVLAARLLVAAVVDLLRAVESCLRCGSDPAAVLNSVPCSVCGTGIPNPWRRWATRGVVCLVDHNLSHHASCRGDCDMCVAAYRIGIRS